MSDPVFEHFTRQAENYEQLCGSGLLGFIRKREQKAMAKLLAGELKDKEVLDLGCGAGMYSRLALALGACKVVAVDRVPAMIEQIKHPDITALVADAGSFSPGHKVGAVIMAGVLEFVPDPTAFMANARNQVETGAKAGVLMPPKTLLIRLYKHYHSGHGINTNLFSKEDLRQMAAKSGWAVEETILLWPFTLLARLRAI